MELVIDPRGKQKRPTLILAPRVSKDVLRNGPILFFDNTKLTFCNYIEVFRRIKKNLAKEGIANFIDYRETVRGKSTQELKDYAAMLSKSGPVAAIIALGDMGTSPATTILTIGLEEQGIPTVYITAPPGHELAKAVAFYRAGQLCLCPLDIYQGSTIENIQKEVDRQMPCLIGSLTNPLDRIRKLHSHQFALDQTVPAENGFLELTGEIRYNKKGFSEPAAYIEEVTDIFNSLHLGDGLPIVPPTQRRYRKMLEYCPFNPDMILAKEIGPSGGNITVRDVAVAAVMAGCKPRYLPVLITAFKAMSNPKYNFLQSVTTSHPGGNMILVSGPLAQELRIHGGQGCLGPGFPANATIGRAINLAIVNICRSVPGYTDLACISSQAEFTYCFAENPELSPWSTINQERFDSKTTTVLVLKAEPPHDIIDFLSSTAHDLLDTIIDSCTTLGSNNSYIPGNIIIVLTPDHARLLDRDGWIKQKIREYIHANAHHDMNLVSNRGIMPVRPKCFETMDPIPVTRSPRDIEIVVAGGRGGHSAVILPWALHSEAVVEPILTLDGKATTTIEDFKRT
jgi:hypothetical protein